MAFFKWLLLTTHSYLLELHAFRELDDMIKANSIALETLPEEDRTIDLQASLPSHLGLMQVRIGEPLEALAAAKLSHDIRLRDVPLDHKELAWAESNIGNVFTSANDYETALEWYGKARDRWQACAKDQGLPVDWPPVMKTNVGRCLIYAKDFKQARSLLVESLEQLKATVPLNWAMVA
jgi:tetratricopeptide (TPR) repeat protein